MSRAAERELTEYLGTESTTPLVEMLRRTPPPSFLIPRRQERAGPEGQEREPKYQEAAHPPQYVLPMIQVPTAPIAPDPMEWDLEDYPYGYWRGCRGGGNPSSAGGPCPSREKEEEEEEVEAV